MASSAAAARLPRLASSTASSSPSPLAATTRCMSSSTTAASASTRQRFLRPLLLGGSRLSAVLPSSASPSSPAAATAAQAASAPRSQAGARPQSLTTLPEAHPRNLPEVWFNATFPPQQRSEQDSRGGLGGPHRDRPPDERAVKLGKTLRILQERLPTLLQSPLPSEILAPTISLHLFPSTHPHLPVVSGRVAYIAALWTSPLAWNRVPLVGNVKLEILSERMAREPLLLHTGSARRAGAGDEQLIVRWRTVGRAMPPFLSRFTSADSNTAATQSDRPAPVGTSQAVDDPKEFTGLFIFEFDGEGRVLSHTIEHVAEGGDWERSVGARFVGLTDWLLGGIRGSGSGSGDTPLPAFQMQDPRKLR